MEQLRLDEGGDWPDWCLLPSVAAAIVIGDNRSSEEPWSAEQVTAIAPLSALFAWRWGRQIIRVDPDLLASVSACPLHSDLPSAAVLSLPGWCLYLAQPGPRGQVGAYVLLEWNLERTEPELRFVLDYQDGSHRDVAVHLGNMSLPDGIKAFIAEAKAARRGLGESGGWSEEDTYGLGDEDAPDLDAVIRPLVATVLYLCSEDADLVTRDTRRSLKRPSASTKEPEIWELGWRVGAQIRAPRPAKTAISETSSHRPPRVHIRAPHWHHYWTGPKHGDRTLVLRWIHPVLVGGSLGDLATTIRDLQ